MLRRHTTRVAENRDDFVSAFVDAGRWYKAEIAIIMLGAVVGLYVFEDMLFDHPAPLVDSWPSIVIGLIAANVLRGLSCLPRCGPRTSTALFIMSIYIDVVWLMIIRTAAVNGGYDVLPIIVPVAFLASLLIVHIRYSVLVPAMIIGYAMIVAIELITVPSSGPGIFSLVTSGAIIVVPLISARFHERQTRLTWERERHLDQLSSTDSLTGLANRRSFDTRIGATMKEGGAVGLVLLDVDRFKVLNDTLGHAAGDDALRAIGEHLAATVADPSTFAARLSGEEFVVVWSGPDRAAATAEAERLREGIGALGLPSGRDGIPVSVSAGFVWIPASSPASPAYTSSDLLRAADRALYDAKRAGRDRLATAEASVTKHVQHPPPVAPQQHARSRLSTFDEALGERDTEFIAEFDASGHQARRVIMTGVLVIVLAVLAVAGHVPPMPPDSLTVSRWFLAVGLAPLALVAVLGSGVPQLRRRSGAIQLACAIAIVIMQTTLRVLPLPEVDQIITVLMPISVILSLGVVEIRFRWMLPAMVSLFAIVTVAELAAFGIDGERILTLLASSSMVAVVIQAAYRHQVVAYKNWKRSGELRTAARIDPLTGLPNRRRFTEDMQLIFDGQGPAAVAAVMIDVDRLKEYNDAYGHPAGDACLQRVAEILAGAAHGHSTQVYRFGGEEFAAVISTPSVADAAPVAEALVAAVAAADIPSATPDRPVTVSAGFTDVRPADQYSTLLVRADAALYQAKRTGRNRLVVDVATCAELSGRRA